MPSNFTENYNLSQWERTDKVLMEDFNADNAKIDAALDKKADKSALNALSQTVSGHTAALNKKGNCRLYLTTCTGNGNIDQPRVHTFPGKPLLVMIGAGDRMFFAFQEVGYGFYARASDVGGNTVSWSGNTMGLLGRDASSQFNVQGGVYTLMALIAADA